MSGDFELNTSPASEESLTGLPGRVERVENLARHPEFTNLLQGFSSVPLGVENSQRLSELLGGNFPQALFDRDEFADPDCFSLPVLPVLRTGEDLTGRSLSFYLRNESRGSVYTVESERVVESVDDCLKVTMGDPYVTLTIDIANPALITQDDFEKFKAIGVGSGNKGPAGLYWRLALLESFCRFAEPQPPVDLPPYNPDTVYDNLKAMARQCGVGLNQDILRMKLEFSQDSSS